MSSDGRSIMFVDHIDNKGVARLATSVGRDQFRDGGDSPPILLARRRSAENYCSFCYIF
jgi:hypothetical protein